jgi:hypothetical protein
MANTLSRKATSKNVKSVIELDKSLFHITSYFDKSTTLPDLLFSAVSENIFCNPLIGRDFAHSSSYNSGED